MNSRLILLFVINLHLCACLLLTPTLRAAESVAQSEVSRLAIEHLFQLGSVSDPQISPEGDWIAYTVTRLDLEEDESRSRVWMVPATGGKPVAMSAKGKSSSHPRWSPDGRYLAFLSARDEGKTQVWSLFRQGGEAVQLTDTAQAVNSFEWSPEPGKMLLVLQDPTPQELEAKEKGEAYKEKTAPAWVIDRQQFKTDYVGYLERRRTHIYLLDIAPGDPSGKPSKKATAAPPGKLTQLTSGDYDDSEPGWSPDGKRIAFTSNRTQQPDNNYNTDIWVVNADGSGQPVRVTSNPGADASPAWSPDGKFITHTSMTNVEAMVYATSHLGVSSSGGGNTQILTAELDRMVYSPRFSQDGQALWFLLEDSGEQNLASMPLAGGNVTRIVRGKDIVSAFAVGPDGAVVANLSRPWLPGELFSLRNGKLKQLTFTNRETLDGIPLGEVEEVRFSSKDGTAIEGFVIKPVGFKPGRRYPTILNIHGGPQSQYDYRFNFEAQLYAANGYLVVLPNPRGSTGYGEAFCLGIWQDWGGPDYEDVMAAIDDAIERGWADPDRLGVTGWSYGGMLTNHVITRTGRFKAAATGASATLYAANYGHDMYQRWWEQELGLPWEPEARELYEKISPFNRLDRVVTPTLILGGEKDWNVPILNSEQLYLALFKLGVETELVVYPGEYHGIDTPSHTKDLYQRYLDWFGERLK